MKRSVLGGAIFIIACAALFAFSKNAHGSLFSFISSMLSSQEASAKISPLPPSQNSQTIALLQAAVNSDPNPNKATEVSPVNANALVADIASSQGTGGPEEINTQISIYTVRPGDNLSTIAEMFDVSVNTIMWANDLKKSSSIQPGQTLVILPVSGITYTVVKGDTIKGIVTKYKVDLQEVLDYNDISINSTLAVGDKIIIPDAEIQTISPTHTASGTTKGGLPSYSGYYLRPVQGVKTQGIHGHNGVDIANSIGTSIIASAEGVVISSMTGGWNGGYGNYIIISHPNGTQTLYAHTSKNLVRAGQYVNQGEKIALLGNTGKSTGPHLHFEIRGAKNPF